MGIVDKLNDVREKAVAAEDGNIVALMDKLIATVKQLPEKYFVTDEEISSKEAEIKKISEPKEGFKPVDMGAPKETPKPIENSTANALKEPTTSKSRAST